MAGDIIATRRGRDGSYESHAIPPVAEQSKLREMAKGHPNAHVRYEAIMRVFDERVIAECAIGDPDVYNAYAAAYRVRDERLKVRIALHAYYETVSALALYRMDDARFLYNVVDSAVWTKNERYAATMRLLELARPFLIEKRA